LPTTQSWKLSTIDSVQYAEYYVKKINTGGMGVGTGLNYGPIIAVNSGCEGINRTFISPVSGTAYQWQADSGSGFVALMDNGQNNGTNTNTLTLVSPATSNYGKNTDVLLPLLVARFIVQLQSLNLRPYGMVMLAHPGILQETGVAVWFRIKIQMYSSMVALPIIRK
jgi:hypothetical protein